MLDWRLIVFILELALTASLIAWLRSASRGEPPPISFLLKLLGSGALAAAIAAVIEYKFTLPGLLHYSNLPYLLFNNIAVSLIEELAKYFVAVLLILHSRYLHKLSDGIFYLIVIGLGFSLVEDALFLLSPQTEAGFRLLSFYLHSGTSAIIGYYLGMYHFDRARWPQLIFGIGLAVTLHLAYNLTTFLPNTPLALYLMIAITLYITLQIFILFRRAVIEEFKIEQQQRPRRRTVLLNI